MWKNQIRMMVLTANFSHSKSLRNQVSGYITIALKWLLRQKNCKELLMSLSSIFLQLHKRRVLRNTYWSSEWRCMEWSFSGVPLEVNDFKQNFGPESMLGNIGDWSGELFTAAVHSKVKASTFINLISSGQLSTSSCRFLACSCMWLCNSSSLLKSIRMSLNQQCAFITLLHDEIIHLGYQVTKIIHLKIFQ